MEKSPMPFAIDTTINLGHLVELATLMVGALGFLYSMKSDIRAVKGDVRSVAADIRDTAARTAAVEAEMKKLTDIAVTLARYDERLMAMTTRINLMDKRWEELRHHERDGAA
jgi:hypothetical protein